MEILREQPKESEPLLSAVVMKVAAVETPRQSSERTRSIKAAKTAKAVPAARASAPKKPEHVKLKVDTPAPEVVRTFPVYEIAAAPVPIAEIASSEQPEVEASPIVGITEVHVHEQTPPEQDVAADVIEAMQASAEKDGAAPIVVDITERLMALDEAHKEALTPLLSDLAEAVQTIQLLLRAEATPEKVAEAKEHVTELVMLLFESLGKECDPEQIEQFVQAMLEASFVERLQDSKVWAQEGLGTHEIKHHFKDLLGTLAGLLPHLRAHRLLGMLAVKNHPQYAMPFATDSLK